MKYAIIGGGLAGMMLAVRLLQKKQQVLLIDNLYPFAASRVAAGMFNVLTGKNFVKSWLADDLLESLHDFFQIPTFSPLQKHLHLQPIYRPFLSIEEYNNFTTKCQTAEYQNFTEIAYQPIYENVLHNPLGGIWINNCGWLNINAFLEELREILLQNDNFTYKVGFPQAKDIHLSQKEMEVEGETYSFEQLILCNGGNQSLSALWQLPVIPNKGEILTIYAPELSLTSPIAGKHYLIPIGNQHFITGATYQWKFDDAEPTQEAAQLLTDYLRELLKISFEIVAHKAGIRPTTSDRRPILGTHHKYSYLHTFTGFGTKGVLLAPHFSQIMAQYLLDNQPLEEEYNLTRFKQK
ncbi:MAG: NAD(P)/FAD-dependent oxidoreductase [Bacteroidia bacterium]